MGIQYNKWELISTWKKFGGRSSLIFSDLCSESEPGNTDSLESSTRPQDHPAQTRPASLATWESKVSSFTESASAEVAVNDQSRRELFMVSHATLVARARSRRPEPTNLSLRSVLVANAATFVFLTHIGLVKMLATNSTKSSLSIHPIRPSDVTHALTGLSHQSTPAENVEDLLPLVRRAEVCFREVTRPTSSDHLSADLGRRQTPRNSGATDLPELIPIINEIWETSQFSNLSCF